MNWGTPGFPVLHYFPEFVQTHVCWVGDTIQPSHLLPASPPALSLSQHQGLFQWVGSLNQVAKVLELQFQHQHFQWIFRVEFLSDLLIWFPCCPRDSQASFPAPQFESINSKKKKKRKRKKASILWCSAFFMVQLAYSYMTTGMTTMHSCDYTDLSWQSDVSAF